MSQEVWDGWGNPKRIWRRGVSRLDGSWWEFDGNPYCHRLDSLARNEKQAAGKTEPAVFKHLPPQLPARMLAEAVWKQLDKKRLPIAGLVDAAKVHRLAADLNEELLGRLLFELAAAARAKDLDPEGALRKETARVMREVENRVGPGSH